MRNFWNKTKNLELLAAFLSGFASLIFQVVWQRIISQEVGIDLLSTKMTVIVFLLGLAFGYQFGRKLSSRRELHFSRWFAGCEVAVGICGFFSITLLRSIKFQTFSSTPYFDLFLSSSLLLIPTFFMGLSTPMLIGASKQKGDNGELIGTIYGMNVLGAAIGAFFSGLVLIECFGLRKTSFFAIGANFIAAIISLFFERKEESLEEIGEEYKCKTSIPFSIICSAVLLGWASLTFEMVSFRSLFYFFGLASYQFPLALGSFLIAMALGEWFGGKLSSFRSIFQIESIPLLTALTSLSICIAFFVTRWAPELTGSGIIMKRQIAFFFVFASFFLSPIIFISAFFPVILGRLNQSKSTLATQTAQLLFIFTLSNAVGGLVTSFLLLPSIGSPKTMASIIFFVALSAVLISKSRQSYIVALGSLCLIFLFQHDFLRSHQANQIEVVEDNMGILSVDKKGEDELNILFFRTPTASAFPGDGVELKKQMRKWSMLDLIATSTFTPKNSLIVGLGNGLVAYGIASIPSMKDVTVIELMPSITKLVSKYSGSQIQNFLKNQVKIITGDGRRYLQKDKKNTKYDLIQVAVFHPWTSGASNVYSREFFDLLSLHLSPKGVVAILSYYPLVDSTAFEVFPYGYEIKGWNNRFHYFSNQAIDFRKAIELKEIPLQEYCEMAGATPSKLDIFRITPGQKSFMNTDDQPLLEYYFLKQILKQTLDFTIRGSQETQSQREFIGSVALSCQE